MAKVTSLINLKPGVDFPEDGTDAYEFIKAMEAATVAKLNELEDRLAALEH